MGCKLSPDKYHELASKRGFEWVGGGSPSTQDYTTWRCKNDHEWEAKYHWICRGNGCPHCAGLAKKTAKDYIDLAARKGYKWLGGEIGNNKKKMDWECHCGYIWQARYNDIDQGYGCPKCAKKDRKKINDFIELAESLDISWLGPEVKNAHTKTVWCCKSGHMWESTYSDIRAGYGCAHCAGLAKKTENDYRLLAKKSGFKWIGPMVANIKTKTWWRCKKGHQWKATYNQVQQGGSCHVCIESNGEREVERSLLSWGVVYKRQVGFSECAHNKKLRFDFCIPSWKILIEYQGEQHYKAINAWGGEEGLRDRIIKDDIKRKFAAGNGYHLIEIPYHIKDIPRHLGTELSKSTGIPYFILTKDKRYKITKESNVEQRSLFDGMIGFLGL